VLLDGTNPYAKPLPDTLELTWDDFTCGLSAANAAALQRPVEWGVLAYAAADVEDLPAYLFDNVLQLKAVGSSDDVHVLSFFEGPLLTDTIFARFEGTTQFADDVMLRWVKRHANDVATLTSALEISAFFPARKRVVFVSGHGRGWRGLLQDLDIARKRYLDAGHLKLPGPNDDCKAHLRAAQTEVQNRFNATLAESRNGPAPRYDVMALDACEMGNLETLVTLAPHAGIIVVSQNQIPKQGYPYASVLARLREQPQQSAVEFATYLVNETKRYHAEVAPARRVTQIAIASDALPPFMDALSALIDALGTMADDAEFAAVQTAIDHAQYYTGTGSIDLKTFLTGVAAGHPRAAAQAAAAEALRRWDAMVVAVSTIEGADTHGLAIYAPAPDQLRRDYFEVASVLPLRIWRWAQFLAAYTMRRLGPTAANHATLSDMLAIPEGVEVRFNDAP
jgi:hypothetical protein